MVISILPYCLFAQSKSELEARKKQLQKDISITNKLLDETKKNKKISLNQLVTLNKKISIREELIHTINAQINLFNKQIRENTNTLNGMERELGKLKDEYAKMIYYANKNRGQYDRLMFIFSSKDFNQAFSRLKYFQQYSEYRKKQADLIVSTKVQINLKIKELEEKKESKKLLLTNENSEKENLSKEKSEKENLLVELQDKEKQLKSELKKKQEDASKLQKAIERIIEEEIRKTRESVKKPGEAPKSLAMTLTPEAKALSANFVSNKGKLPWPVENGVITETFGEHDHPVLKGIKIKNNGIDISTTPGSLVRAVFSGEVIRVITIPGAGKAIIINHGEYFSVYGNLKEVYVKPGEKITTKQNLGKVDTDDADKTEAHLEIWKMTDNGSVMQNPSLWIFRNN